MLDLKVYASKYLFFPLSEIFRLFYFEYIFDYQMLWLIEPDKDKSRKVLQMHEIHDKVLFLIKDIHVFY